MVFAAIFALVVGISMIGQWAFFYFSNQIPELQTEPYRIGFHLAGEMATALALVVAGIGLLSSVAWAEWLFLVAMGMLFYTAIVSPGYFAQRGEWPLVGMFAGLLILALVSLIVFL